MSDTPMKTGIRGFDHLVKGGLVRGNSLLIEGPPGSGKSTFGMRILYEGAVQFKEPGLIVSFEEFPQQLYDEALQLGMDFQALEQAGLLRIVSTPPSVLESFAGKNELMEHIVQELGVRRLLIDSITHFRRAAVTEIEQRDLLARILATLKLKGINALLIKELEQVNEQAIAFEEYLVDASVRLHNQPAAGGGENIRLIEVRKTRGQPHITGRHPFEITSEGFHVYPRLRPVDVQAAFAGTPGSSTSERVPTGVEGLDRMLDGGLWEGSLNLVSGLPGTGKSVVANHYIDTGLQAGESCLLLSVKNTAEEILAQAASVGMEWRNAYERGQLQILHDTPTGLCIEKLMDNLMVALRMSRPRRLVFDSIDDLWSAVHDEDCVRDHVVILATAFRAAGTTSLVMSERRDGGRLRQGDVPDFSYLANCVVHLASEQSNGHQSRFVSVTKHAGSKHAQARQPYLIGESGLLVASPAA